MTLRASIARSALLLAAAVCVPYSAAAKEASPLSGSELPAPVLESLEVALASYEEIRAALAADSLEGVADSAAGLAGALRPALTSRGELDEEVPSLVEEAAFMAESVATAEDLASARASFAELSRRFLQLAQYDARVTEGLNVFSCPMVDTFDKWIQPGEQIENPYMGSEMLTCGSSTDWSAAKAASWLDSLEEVPDPTGNEPTFERGIPGMEMVDVRDYKFLWREIEELQRWEYGQRITVVEFREKVVEKTAQYLELESEAAAEFVEKANTAVASVRDAFSRQQQPGPSQAGAGSGFSTELRATADELTSLLSDDPRHQLFRPEVKKWLLKLAFGPREAKEAREAS